MKTEELRKQFEQETGEERILSDHPTTVEYAVWLEDKLSQLPTQEERLTHEKVEEVLNGKDWGFGFVPGGAVRIEYVKKVATAICSLSTEQAEVSEGEIRDIILIEYYGHTDPGPGERTVWVGESAKLIKELLHRKERT